MELFIIVVAREDPPDPEEKRPKPDRLVPQGSLQQPPLASNRQRPLKPASNMKRDWNSWS